MKLYEKYLISEISIGDLVQKGKNLFTSHEDEFVTDAEYRIVTDLLKKENSRLYPAALGRDKKGRVLVQDNNGEDWIVDTKKKTIELRNI